MLNTEGAKQLANQSENSQVLLQLLFVFALVFNLLMQSSGSLELMVSMINSLQLIIHLPLMNITLPANALIVFISMRPFIMFDLIELLEKFHVDVSMR